MINLKGSIRQNHTLNGGLAGLAGKDGKSAYEIAVENGFVGSEEAWLESLKGSSDFANHAVIFNVGSSGNVTCNTPYLDVVNVYIKDPSSIYVINSPHSDGLTMARVSTTLSPLEFQRINRNDRIVERIKYYQNGQIEYSAYESEESDASFAETADYVLSDRSMTSTYPYVYPRSVSRGFTDGRRIRNKKIIGGTLFWNQLSNPDNGNIVIPYGHKYLKISSRTDGEIGVGDGETSIDGNGYNVFNLTKIFGAYFADHLFDIEQEYPGSGIYTLMELYPVDELFGFNAGQMLNVKTSGHKMTMSDGTVRLYSVSDIELRGILKYSSVDRNPIYDGDIYESDGTVTRRFAVIDLGDFTWSQYNPIPNSFATTGGLPGDWKTTSDGTQVINAICSEGNKAMSYSDIHELLDVSENAMSYNIAGGGLIIKDDALSAHYNNFNAGAFKNVMAGKKLVYEISTPVIEHADPFIELQVTDPEGTEEYIDTRDIPVPVGNESVYYYDITGRAEKMLPDDLPESEGVYVLKYTNTEGVRGVNWEEDTSAQTYGATFIEWGDS